MNKFLILGKKDHDTLYTLEINFDPKPKSIGFFKIVGEKFHHCKIFKSEQKTTV